MKPIIGESTLTNEKVIELAGDAANGVVAHVGLTADAPNPSVQAFVKRYEAEFGDPAAFLDGAYRSMLIAYVPD